MLSRVDEQVRQQARDFRLRFACAECAHLDTERSACSAGYPPEAFPPASLETVDAACFCKSFELV